MMDVRKAVEEDVTPTIAGLSGCCEDCSFSKSVIIERLFVLN
jgi:hypothetical protein